MVHLGPGLAQGFSVRLTCVWLEALNSSSSSLTVRCHHTITSLPLTSLLISSQPACFPKPNPIPDSCAHIPLGLHARAVKWDTGEERMRREKPCLKLTFRLMIYEQPPTPFLVYRSGFGLQCGNTG